MELVISELLSVTGLANMTDVGTHGFIIGCPNSRMVLRFSETLVRLLSVVPG